MGLVKSDKGAACICLPLAAAGLLAGSLFTLAAVYSLIQAVKGRATSDVSSILQIVLAVLQLLFGVFTIFGCLFRQHQLCQFGIKLSFIWCGVVLLSMLAAWYYWAVQIAKKDYNADRKKWVDKDYHLTTKSYVNMGFGTAIYFASIVLLIYLASVFASLARVFKAGGSGWRLESPEDIKAERQIVAAQI